MLTSSLNRLNIKSSLQLPYDTMKHIFKILFSIFLCGAVFVSINHTNVPYITRDNAQVNTSTIPQPIKINTTLLFIIITHTTETEVRNTMRNTFLATPSKRFKWMFVVGKGNFTEKFHKENEKYKDIYLVESDDGYDALSYKILLGFEKAVQHFNFEIIMKADTDTYVDVKGLINYFVKLDEKGLYAGVLGHFSTRELGHKSLKNRTASERRVRYMLGGGYALSYILVSYFVDNWHLFQIWKPEDLTIGVHLNQIYTFEVSNTNFFHTADSPAECSPNFLVKHKVSQKDMYYLHYSLLETGKMCEYASNKTIKELVAKKYKIEQHG
eukprot:Phypoly_transcript_13843.p1 GENE.Phypoly_transcript_13843~~Phypoly_transcript_13843.p1  ORF type:complete len:326 (+),score=37.74 Phypoly_transcript_13843:13-990(+)